MFCDQLHRVAASRLLSLSFYIAKVQKNSETTKYFRKFFRKKYTKGTVPFVYPSFMSTFLFSSFLHYLQFGNKFFVVTTLGTLNSLLVNEPFQRFLS